MSEKQITIDLVQLKNQFKTEICKRADEAEKTHRGPTDEDTIKVIFNACPWIKQLLDYATSEILLDMFLEKAGGMKGNDGENNA